MTQNTIEQTAIALSAADGRDPERMRAALSAAERRVRTSTPAAVAEQAVADLWLALTTAGAPALDGGDPQAIEDALYAARPDSPLAEQTLRTAWLALADDLARTGDKPPFGGSGGAESWAFVARSRPWPFVDPDGVVERIVGSFGQQRVVIVRGPGRSSVLAAVRRALLAAHGAEALVPPVMPAARDAVGGLLRPYVNRAPLPDELIAALDKLRYPEDLLGVLGRGGQEAPVALLLDDAHLQSRAVLLGLPLYLEPAQGRQAMVVLAAPEASRADGPLNDLIADARQREILDEITLPGWDASMAQRWIDARFGGDVRAASWGSLLDEQLPTVRSALRMRAAHAWLDALADGARVRADGAERLRGGLDLDALLPAHAGARAALAIAALDGAVFHGFAVGKVLGQDEDWVEDLLQDDEFELDGAVVGTCEGAVPADAMGWTDLPDGLHPTFRFADARVVAALVASLDDQQRIERARALRDALLGGYTGTGAWQIADRIYRLSEVARDMRPVQQWLLGTSDVPRVEAGFRRMLPILQAGQVYTLALSRLYGAAMEAGSMGTMTGRIQLADQGFQSAAAAAQRLERPGAAGEAMARLAEVRLALALPGPTRQALDIAEQLMRKAGHARSLARLALMRAEVAVLDGELDGALDQLRTGIAALREVPDPGHAALGLVRQGRLLFERGDAEAAVLALDEAMHFADTSGDPRAAGAARMARAYVHAESDQLEPAFRLLQQAAGAFQRAGLPVHMLEVAAAGLQRRHGNPVEAEKRLRAVGEQFRKAKAAVQWADAWHGLARCLIDQEKWTDAVQALEEIEPVRNRARDRFGLVRMYLELGNARLGQGDRVGAFTAWRRARRLAERLQLVRRLGELDASLAQVAGTLDARPDVDRAQLEAEADATIDEIEALWKAGPQSAERSQEVH